MPWLLRVTSPAAEIWGNDNSYVSCLDAKAANITCFCIECQVRGPLLGEHSQPPAPSLPREPQLLRLVGLGEGTPGWLVSPPAEVAGLDLYTRKLG